MPLSPERFLRQLIDSGLMSAAEVQELEASLPAEARQANDAQAVARELVARKKLTPYQAVALYQGKGQQLVLGNYVILDKLGQGGMGMVLKAEQRRLKRVVAIKVMSQAAMKSPDAVKRFHREVEAAAKLTHPHIVAALDANEARGVHFLVMDYVEGSDLAALVKKNGPLPVVLAMQCILHAARGLEYAHSQGVVHRDVKPANLLLDKNGTVKILDMGLARLTDAASGVAAAGLTQSGSIMGTVDYMSPEQALHTKYANRPADIYSLGCSLYYLLTGTCVYAGESLMEKLLAHREQPIPSLSATRAEVPPAVDSVFHKMVAKKPEDRYASMTDVIRDLEACLGGGPVSAPAASPGWAPASPFSMTGTGTMGSEDPDVQEFLKAIAPAASTTNVQTNAGTAPASETMANRVGEHTHVAGAESRRQTWRRFSARQKWLMSGVVVVLVSFAGWLLSNQRGPAGSAGPSATKAGNDSNSPPTSDRRVATTWSPKRDAEAVTSDPDRRAAEWALKQGGEIELEIDEERQVVRLTAALPEGPLHLTGINLAGRAIFSTEMVNLAGLRELESLNLSGNWNFTSRVSDSGLEHIADLTTLQNLDLSFSAISEDGLKHLRNLKNLRALSFYFCPNVRDEGVAHLAELRQLEWLHLGGTKVTDEGLKHLQNMTELTNVLLDGPPIKGHGLAYLANAKRLSWIHLANDPLDDDEFEVVTQLVSVEQLSLTNTSLTDRSVKYLKTMQNLKHLHIGGTQITDAGAAELKAALPNCEIGR